MPLLNWLPLSENAKKKKKNAINTNWFPHRCVPRLDFDFVHAEVLEADLARVPRTRGPYDEARVLGSVRHQDQRQDTLVHVERIETEVEVAVDGLEHIFGKSEGCVGARVKCVWKEKKKIIYIKKNNK